MGELPVGDDDRLANPDEPIPNISDYEEASLVGGGKSTRESMKRPKYGSPSKERVLHVSKPRNQFEHAAAAYKAEVKDLMKKKDTKSKREASPLIDHN